jgi:hypothetical protein
VNGFVSELDDKLRAAHYDGAHYELVDLYESAAMQAFDRQEVDRACFYLTHSYIFALETRHPSCRKIHSILVKHDREE